MTLSRQNTERFPVFRRVESQLVIYLQRIIKRRIIAQRGVGFIFNQGLYNGERVQYPEDGKGDCRGMDEGVENMAPVLFSCGLNKI